MIKKTFIYIIPISVIKRIAICIITICILLIAGFTIKQDKHSTVYSSSIINDYNTIMKRDLLCIMIAYWQYVKGVQRMSDDKVYLVMNSGNRILYDDKKTKTFDEKFNNADLQDMMEQIYPLYSANYLRSKDFNPGRFRVYALFREVYGSTKQKIEENLVSVKFGNSNLLFNKNNNASNALMRINSELVSLTRTRKDITSFVFPSSGTFKYRSIAGTGLLSAHSFGTAIDLAANGKDYWQWASRNEGQKRMSVYPPEVVRIFEKNNFIWGGRWGYFDLMHYEYRPELLLFITFIWTSAVSDSRIFIPVSLCSGSKAEISSGLNDWSVIIGLLAVPGIVGDTPNGNKN